MLKRRTGLYLLTLLVITGLAGTLRDNTLHNGERKYALAHMKETYHETLEAVSGLSDRQLRYKPAKGEWSVQEIFYHLAGTEKVLWSLFEKWMKEPANPSKRKLIRLSDHELLEWVENTDRPLQAPLELAPSRAGYKNFRQALNRFKKNRLQYIRYMRTSTEDLRNHVMELPMGWVDGYQFYLFIAGHCRRHTQQINDLINSPGFPIE